MNICPSCASHASQSPVAFCADCVAVHSTGFALSLPMLLAGVGVGLMLFAAARLWRFRRMPRLATA